MIANVVRKAQITITRGAQSIKLTLMEVSEILNKTTISIFDIHTQNSVTSVTRHDVCGRYSEHLWLWVEIESALKLKHVKFNFRRHCEVGSK